MAAAPRENLLHPSRWPSSTTTPREAHACSAAKSRAATQKTNRANAPADRAARPAPSRRNDGVQPATIPASRRHRRADGNRRLRRTAQGALAVHRFAGRGQAAVRDAQRRIDRPHHPRAQSPHVRREAGAARAHSPLGQARGGCRGQVHRRAACAGKNQRRSRRVSRAEIRDTRPRADRRVLRVPAPPPPRGTHPRHADPRRLLGASAVRGDGSVLERPLQHRHLQGRMQMAQAGRRPQRHSATRAWKVPRTPRRLGQEPGDAHLP